MVGGRFSKCASACDHKGGEGKTSARPIRLVKRRANAYAELRGLMQIVAAKLFGSELALLL